MSDNQFACLMVICALMGFSILFIGVVLMFWYEAWKYKNRIHSGE